MNIPTMFAKQSADTETLTVLQKMELASPIYKEYLAHKTYLEGTIRTMKQYNLDDPNVRIRLNYSSFLSEEAFQKAAKKHNEQRAEEIKKSIATFEKKLQDLTAKAHADLSSIWQ